MSVASPPSPPTIAEAPTSSTDDESSSSSTSFPPPPPPATTTSHHDGKYNLEEFNFDFNPHDFNTSIFAVCEDPVSCLDATACTICLLCRIRNAQHSTLFPKCLDEIPAKGCQNILTTLCVIPIPFCSCIDRDGVIERYNMNQKSSNCERLIGFACPCLSVAQTMREVVLRGESPKGLFFGTSPPRLLHPCCCFDGKGNLRAAQLGRWGRSFSSSKTREGHVFATAPKIERMVTAWSVAEARREEARMQQMDRDQNRVIYLPAAMPFGGVEEVGDQLRRE